MGGDGMVRGNPRAERAASAARAPAPACRDLAGAPVLRAPSAPAGAPAPAAPARPGAPGRVLRALSRALVALAAALAFALVGVRLIGLTPYAVLSGSMEPELHVGSLVYVRGVDPFELEEGDVVTFMLDEDTLATHRIVEVVPDEGDPEVVRFRTKGDANEAADGSLVHCKNVVGEAVFSVPCLGYVADLVQGPPGCYLAVAACAVLVMLTFLPDLFAEEEDAGQARASGGRGPAPAASRASASRPRGRHARPD